MARRHLHELLREKQEPFVLKSFIDEKRCQLRRTSSSSKGESRTQQLLQFKKRVPPPVCQNHTFPPSSNLSKSPSSFIPFCDSSNSRRSPLFDLPAKSPSSSTSSITAVLLLEAALRIQKKQQQQTRTNKKKKRNAGNPSKNFGFGFLASILNKLVLRKWQRGEIAGDDEVRVSVKDILRWESCDAGEDWLETLQETPKCSRKEAVFDMGNNPHSSPRMNPGETESSRCSNTSKRSLDGVGIPEEITINIGDSSSSQEEGFSSSPSRSLPASSSSPHQRTPEFESRGSPPSGRKTERQLFDGGPGEDGESIGGVRESYYEEEKEQFSPVSVLDLPFQEDHRDHPESKEEEEEEEEEEEAEEEVLEQGHVGSFQHRLAIVQRAKQQLLSKIRRFERLADLDPIELDEQRIAAEEEDDGYDDSVGRGVVECENKSADLLGPVETTEDVYEFVEELWGRVDAGCARKLPTDVNRLLVLDLITEEERGAGANDDAETTAAAAEKVRRRFEEWKEVESNTIDTMVGMDLRREGDEWKRNWEQLRETAVEIEVAVFGFLVDEISEDLVH